MDSRPFTFHSTDVTSIQPPATSPVASRRPVGYPFPMSGVLAHLPEVFGQELFNLERWSELERDSFFAAIDCRIETDRYGQVLLKAPPGFEHSNLQGLIFETLLDLMGSAEEKHKGTAKHKGTGQYPQDFPLLNTVQECTIWENHETSTHPG
jgi:hypothetical protein